MLRTSLNQDTFGSRTKLPVLIAALLGLVFLVAACGGSDSVETTETTGQPTSSATTAPTQEPAAAPTAGVATKPATVNANRKVGGEVGDLAPEFGGIDAWINGNPLIMEELRGQVVLIDFWTYTCINCIRTFPFLKQWHSRYADDGLVIVGVHAPEFEFEKVYENVVAATKEHALGWTMAQDNDFVTRRRYSNRF